LLLPETLAPVKPRLQNLLSKHYKWIPHFEDVDHNPYLNDFYEDMPRWSFQLQIYFLNSRINQLAGDPSWNGNGDTGQNDL
jgi:deoxyadenosine/deoxycytidine kinase